MSPQRCKALLAGFSGKSDDHTHACVCLVAADCKVGARPDESEAMMAKLRPGAAQAFSRRAEWQVATPRGLARLNEHHLLNLVREKGAARAQVERSKLLYETINFRLEHPAELRSLKRKLVKKVSRGLFNLLSVSAPCRRPW